LAPDIERLLEQLHSTDASVAYRSFWTLVAGGEPVSRALSGKIMGVGGDTADAAAIERWLRELDHDDFAVREQAAKQLALHLDSCQTRIERELRETMSAEVRVRLETILAAARAPQSQAQQDEQRVRRIVRTIGLRARQSQR
jgi:hypothetical protein